MKLIDNVNDLLGDDIKKSVQPGARLKIAASCFSIYAFEALKRELESVESFEFIFTSPSFMPDAVTDAAKKERREFHIPKSDTERSFYGTEFEVQLKNKLTQRAIARECADWMRRKAKFRSNSGGAPSRINWPHAMASTSAPSISTKVVTPTPRSSAAWTMLCWLKTDWRSLMWAMACINTAAASGRACTPRVSDGRL